MYYNKQKINILYLITTFHRGGPGNVLLNILKNLDRSKFEPIAACMYKGGELEEDIRCLNIKTFNLKMVSPLRGWLDFRAIFAIRKLIKKYNIALIHAHLLRPVIFSCFASIFLKVPLIVTKHEPSKGEQLRKGLLNTLAGNLEQYALARAERVICVSKGVKEYLLKHFAHLSENKVDVIYNGVEMVKFFNQKPNNILRKEYNISADVVVIGTLCLLIKRKGLHFLIEAAERLIPKYKKVRFIIVGEGVLKEELLQEVKNKNLEKYVIFTGFRKDTSEILTDFDVFVLPSIQEGLPIALIEAMAAGLPCVATDIPGNSEVVEDGITGFLVPPKDPVPLAQAIEKLILEKGLRENMGKRGRQRFLSNFNAKTMALKYQQSYFEIIKEKNLKYGV